MRLSINRGPQTRPQSTMTTMKGSPKRPLIFGTPQTPPNQTQPKRLTGRLDLAGGALTAFGLQFGSALCIAILRYIEHGVHQERIKILSRTIYATYSRMVVYRSLKAFRTLSHGT